MQPKERGGEFHLKLNKGERPIANKYSDGKMQRTLKRESKVLEIVQREAFGFSICSFCLCANCNTPAIKFSSFMSRESLLPVVALGGFFPHGEESFYQGATIR